MSTTLELTGKRIGRLAIGEVIGRKRGHKLYLCLCDCGNKHEVASPDLKSGRTKSCGCLRRELRSENNITHNLRNHRLYSIWANMKTRCYNPNGRHYHRYGGRGIRICNEWRNNFKSFYDWSMENGYEPGLTIDRIDNDGNYEPSNCRWTTSKKQGNNTRRCIFITINGETKTLTEWCESIGINYRTVQDRRKRGWSIEEALFTPVGESG